MDVEGVSGSEVLRFAEDAGDALGMTDVTGALDDVVGLADRRRFDTRG